MFKRNHKIEVVQESEYTDFSARLNETATLGTVVAASVVPVVASVGLLVHRFSASNSSAMPVSAPIVSEPINVLADAPVTIATGYVPQPTGLIADTSLEMLASVLDPLIQIMVAISFPIASVIMVASCFYFMIGNNERAWDGIFKSALGYILIQLSPLFLGILKEVGKAV